MDIIYSVFATIVKADILLQDKLFSVSFDFMYISQQIILFIVLILCVVLAFLYMYFVFIQIKHLIKYYVDINNQENK